MSCGKITQNILFDCEKTATVTGVEKRMVLLNRGDFQVTLDANNKHLVTDITLNSGATGYAIEDAKGKAIKPSYEPDESGPQTTYRHKVGFIIYENSAAIKQEISRMTNGSLVAIVENKDKGTNGGAAFEIYGLNSGLMLKGNSRDPHSKETGAGYSLSLENDEDSPEPTMPLTLYKTDYATTKALFDGLYTIV